MRFLFHPTEVNESRLWSRKWCKNRGEERRGCRQIL
jgi:hypothetical protein